MDEFDETDSKINRLPGTFKFKVPGETQSRMRRALLRMEDVKVDTIDWLWEPYIPLGRLTILGGDPGAGKSFITTGIAAALSRGDALPGEEVSPRAPMVTLLLNAEDDPGDTIKPRLNNMEADQTKIFVSALDIILDGDGLVAIEEMIEDTRAKLVIIDPIVAFLGPKIDMNRANEIRHIMKALAAIARKKNIAIVIVRHNRKMAAGAPKGNAIYNGMGSIDFTAAVRSELAVVEKNNGMKFLNHIKTNSSRMGMSIVYKIISLDDGSGKLCWGEMIDHRAANLASTGGITRSFRDEPKVREWLHDLLSQEPDGLRATDIIQRAGMKGYSQTKIEHAKKGVVVSAKRKDGWYWLLDRSASGPLVPDDEIGV